MPSTPLKFRCAVSLLLFSAAVCAFAAGPIVPFPMPPSNKLTAQGPIVPFPMPPSNKLTAQGPIVPFPMPPSNKLAAQGTDVPFPPDFAAIS